MRFAPDPGQLGGDVGLGHGDRRPATGPDDFEDAEVADACRHVEAEGQGPLTGLRRGVGQTGIEGTHQRRHRLALHADHAWPAAVDQAECLEFLPGFPHAEHPGAAAGGIDDRVGQTPAGRTRCRFGQLETERFLALDAPARLLERGHGKVALRNVLLPEQGARLANGRTGQFQNDSIWMPVCCRSHVAEDRRGCIAGHRHDHRQPCRQRVVDQRIAGIALGRRGQPLDAEPACLGDHHGHAAVLEALRGVGTEAGVGLALFLDREVESGFGGDGMAGVVEQRGRSFAERDDVRGVDRMIDVERHEATEAPDVLALRLVPGLIRSGGGEPLKVEDHLDRAAIQRIEVHRLVGGILGTRSDAAQAADEAHQGVPADFGSIRSQRLPYRSSKTTTVPYSS